MLPTEIVPLLTFLIGLFAALYLIPRLAGIARSIGLLDRPGEKRKVHTVAKPLVGGIGMVLAGTFAATLTTDFSAFCGLFLGLIVLLATGFLDDFRELDSKHKFIAQIIATISIIVFGNTTLTSFGNLLAFGEIALPHLGIIIWPITIFCIVGVINALNLMDGLDGLAGGISFIVLVAFAIQASLGQQYNLALLNLAFAGAVLGFLRFNWSPATVFMGDGGSLCLGFVLGYMSLKLTQGPHAVMSPVIPLISLAIPITDTITVMSKRILRKKNPFLADHYHLHHILMRCGMGRDRAVRTILIATALLNVAGLAITLKGCPDYVPFLLYLTFFGIYVVGSFFILHAMRLSLRFRRRHQEKNTETSPADYLARRLLNQVDLLHIFRKERRWRVQLPVTLILEDGSRIEGTVANLSRRGCMIANAPISSLYEEVHLAIRLTQEDPPLELKAEHLWIYEGEGGNDTRNGFKFAKESEEKSEAIRRYAEQQNKNTRDTGYFERTQTLLRQAVKREGEHEESTLPDIFSDNMK